MLLNITGKNIELTDALKDHVSKKLEILNKHGHNVHKTHVILAIEHLNHIAEATLTLKGDTIHAKSEESDMYQAIDDLARKLDTQLTKHKEKTIDEHR